MLQVPGTDADKQALLHATGLSHDGAHSAPESQTAEQISTILREQFGILPKRRAIDYTKPYPSDYDLIPLLLSIGFLNSLNSVEHKDLVLLNM
jgi:hypothetical protein